MPSPPEHLWTEGPLHDACDLIDRVHMHGQHKLADDLMETIEKVQDANPCVPIETRPWDGARLMWVPKESRVTNAHGYPVRRGVVERDVAACLSLAWIDDEVIEDIEAAKHVFAQMAEVRRENASLTARLASAHQCIEEVRASRAGKSFREVCARCDEHRCARCRVIALSHGGKDGTLPLTETTRGKALILIQELRNRVMPDPSHVAAGEGNIALGWGGADGVQVVICGDGRVVLGNGHQCSPSSWVGDVLGAVANPPWDQPTAKRAPQPHEARGPACAMSARPERTK